VFTHLLPIRLGACCLVAGAILALGAGQSAKAASSCGILTTSGHSFIVVATGMPCSAATGIVRRLGAQTATLHVGQTVKVARPPAGFVCVIQNRAKPAGSCNSGPRKIVTWLVAA
jgi:hypothetical protein